jgi:hypothetical protein
MKKQMATIATALILVGTAPISAFCASASGGAPGPLSGVHLSLAHPPVLVLAQAKPESAEGAKDAQSYTNTLVSGGLLTQNNGTDNSQASDNGGSNQGRNNPSGGANTAAGDSGPHRCKNGKSEGNKHCVPSPSE